MGEGAFWILVFPALAAAVLVWLALLVVGLGVIRAARRSSNPVLRAALLSAGLAVIASPVLYHTGLDRLAQQKADRRAADLSRLERVDLAGRLPKRFIAVGDFRPELLSFIEAEYRISRFPENEETRLIDAYRLFRSAERCNRRFAGETQPGTKLSKCRAPPESLQRALALRESVLVFAEGRHTSMRDDNVLSGEIYEIRLITPQEDLLVDYFEERTVEDFPSIFNPYAARRRNAADEAPPTLKAFIETAMEEARR